MPLLSSRTVPSEKQGEEHHQNKNLKSGKSPQMGRIGTVADLIAVIGNKVE